MAVKDLVVQDEAGQLVSWEDFAGDFEPDGTEEIRPSFPMIKIVQGTSTMPGAGKHGGEFFASDTEEFISELRCVALVLRKTRALFEEGNDQPVCLSVDGVGPLPNQPRWTGNVNGQPVSCDACPLSVWGEDSSPPPCQLSEVLLVDRGDGDLAQLRVKGKSLKPLHSFIARKCKPKHLPLYAYRLTLTTEEKSDVGKKWHELVITGDLMTPKEAKVYSDMLRAERERFEKTLADQGQVEWQDDGGHADVSWEEA